MALTWTTKYPAEVLDYSWQVPIDTNDSIASFLMTVVEGTISLAGFNISDDKCVATVSGGAIGETCQIDCTATTVGGDTFVETIYLAIVSSANILAAQLSGVFPAFATVPTATIAYWIERALEVTGDWQNDHATMLLACHLMTQNGLGDSAEAQRAVKFGGATNIKSGTLSLSWEGNSGTGFQSTNYGRQFAEIIKSRQGGPLVTGTGKIIATHLGYPHGFA